MQKRNIIRYFGKNVITVIALVLVWRGVWYVLDGIDYWFFGGYNAWTGLIGILVGVLILYIPDKDLKEIEKL
ncbi:MAG: hypothetical protein RLZZ517_580 [Candidatus Parcubacteria bacterium]|jgi:hypothetical protein